MVDPFILITPTKRVGNLESVYDSIVHAAERAGIEWRWILGKFVDEGLEIPGRITRDKRVEVHSVSRIDSWCDVFAIENQLLDSIQDDRGWIWQVQDDNLVAPWAFAGWIEGIRTGKRVIVGSHHRGSGSSRHGSTPLIAAAVNMLRGRVSLEQYLVHSSIHSSRRYENSIAADGYFVENLWRDIPGEFHFMPDFFIPFNVLEPGRWEPGELERFMDRDR